MRQTQRMETDRIYYLNQREKQASRALYEAAFPEDSKEFIDYYYKWKTKDNEIIVMEGAAPDSSFHVMIHLNPYCLNINGCSQQVPYIVAVATDERYRRQGKMGQVMARALQDMEHRQVPFTFLLPADPAYYRGQGFVFFSCQDYLQRGGICIAADEGKNLLRAASADAPINDSESSDGHSMWNNGALPFDKGGSIGAHMVQSAWTRADKEDFEEMASFSNKILKDRCEVFIWRDISYYRRLINELASERGGALLLREHPSEHSGALLKKPELCGILLYSVSGTQEKTAEVKELLLKDSMSRQEAEQICRNALKRAGHTVHKIKFTSSRMMVRVTNLRALAPLLRSERRTVLSVKVADSLIKENNGCFRIETSSVGGRISEIAEESTEQQMDIGELAEVLFQDVSVYLNEWV